MYENETFNNILKRSLDKVPTDVDKRQGSIIYDALAPVCAELAQVYIALDWVLKEGFADTASREYLIKRARERGLAPYEATSSIILAELTGNINLKGGERFNAEDINFYYIGEKEDKYYKLKCETPGEIGNITYGSLIPIDNIPNLQKASIHSLLTVGVDEEDTEDFRKRYFNSFKNYAFGGNRADYKEKLQSLNKVEEITNNGGVGGVKIYRTPDGAGTVHIYIQTLGYNKPTDTLIELVQKEVDPEPYKAEGYGIAPIGHFVTVKSVDTININIDTVLELKPGFSLEDIKEYINQTIENYLQELRESWQDEEYLVIRIAKIEALILDINGVVDIGETKINNVTSNLNLDKNTIPIRRDINAVV